MLFRFHRLAPPVAVVRPSEEWDGVPQKWQGLPQKWQGMPLFGRQGGAAAGAVRAIMAIRAIIAIIAKIAIRSGSLFGRLGSNAYLCTA